ncbi:DNA alkylation repair protein [Pseudoflavitalea sp. G-6-1-2]|uniref:DNA alkylation repair protein n=1 Tax=Pseudoflavitalea sp. G-6-1-2 TaxID=2728841 RepID=UPI00146B4BF2|nr:DNA alkylation repair protein [Pseudoflavitalea sp. G-6-1-2]NML23819.1 DNA alkylation repair protein [Pseudoflavitalea sp. G-6-1-2]
MADIKDVYSKEFYQRFAKIISPVVPGFDEKQFMRQVLPKNFVSMEWKERMIHTADTLATFLPESFSKAAPMLLKIQKALVDAGEETRSFPYIFLPEMVSRAGLEHFDLSVKTMESLTQLISAEFAVRPFLLKYEGAMIKEMMAWSTHRNAAVRRLASEGSRPRLPWGLAIPFLKKDPAPILPILENLKQDPNEIVRRSVANNLNDISKDNPAVVLKIAAQWKGISAETDAIIKHGSRTLLKQGHTDILSHYGLRSAHFEVTGLKVTTPVVKMGDHLSFVFDITNKDNRKQTVRLEYGIHYLKANGTLSRKVFKISEKEMAAKAVLQVQRKQSFKLITTRVFYPGKHELSIIVNGVEMARSSFLLK